MFFIDFSFAECMVFLLIILLIGMARGIKRKIGDIKDDVVQKRYRNHYNKCKEAQKLYGHLMKFTPEDRQIFLSKSPYRYTKLCLWAQNKIGSIEDYILMVAGEKAHDKGCIRADIYSNIRKWYNGEENRPQGVDEACALYGYGEISLEQLIGRIDMILAKKHLNIFDEEEGQLYKNSLEQYKQLDPGLTSFMIEHTN